LPSFIAVLVGIEIVFAKLKGDGPTSAQFSQCPYHTKLSGAAQLVQERSFDRARVGYAAP
jgi:hypothetical protein